MKRARVTGAARLGGIVGRPVTHSLSPVIHNAWLDAAGLDAVYAAFSPSTSAGFGALVAAGRAGLIAGVNVTAPFKEQAFACADSVSASARGCGSANVLIFSDGEVAADSTDGLGLILALADQAPHLTLQGATVVMLGAGGAARAAVAALDAEGATVRIVNRTPERAEQLARDIGGRVRAASGEAAFEGAELIINALSVSPEIDPARIEQGATVMDMTYRPVRTAFLQQAEAMGLATVDGLAMLIGQAGPSFRAIFGVEPPALDPRPLLMEHLAEPHG